MAFGPVAHRFPAPSQRRADQRGIDTVRAYVRAYALDAHVPRVRALLDRVERSGRERDLQELQDVITPYVTFHEREYPFVVAPRGALDGRPFVTPLRQAADGQRLTLDESELAAHVAVYGRSGGGKTTIVQQFAHAAYRSGISVVAIDGKDDARYFATMYPETIVIGPHTKIPFLEPPPWLSPAEARSLLIKPLKQTMWGGEGLAQVATESHERTFVNHVRPSLRDWCDEARAMTQRSDTYTRRDRCEGLAQRLHRCVEQYPGLGTPTGAGIPLELLCTRPLLFSFGMHTEIEDYLTHWLLELRFGYNRAHNRRSLNTFVLLDESNLLVHDKTIQEEAPLATLFPLLREFGISVGLTASNYRAVPATVRSSIFLQIATNLTDAREASEIARTFGCDQEQQQYHATRLGIGSAIARLGDRWKYPFIAQFDPLDYDKRVHPADWQAALERTNALARTERLAAREESSGQQPTPTTRSASASPPATLAPVVEKTSPNARRIALNKHAGALMTDVSEHPFTLCTQAYRRCRVRLSEGDRARSQAERLQLLNASRVTCGRGRGKSGICLSLSERGWHWIGRTPTKGLRGGSSVQHSFCVFELHRRIRPSHVEEYLDTTAIDLAISFNTEQHETFYRAIAALTGTTPHLNDGDVIAVEVEITGGKRSAERNAAKNEAAGVALTIIAIDHKAPERLATNLPSNTLVVDVYALLDALRTTEDR